MSLVKRIIFMIIIPLGITCSGDDGEEIIEPIINPTAVTLNFPLNNTECNEGRIISETISEVVFKWTVSSKNNSYTVSLKNLETNSIKNYNTNLDELAISILRGIPYSWSVVSKVAGNSKTAESAIWKFYNAGIPQESHPPFPAEAVNPAIGASIESGTITLQWEGADVDDDIAFYKILLDNSESPTTSIGNTTSNSINIEVEPGKIYYWKVISTDAIGNSSDSEIFQFKAN